MIKKSLMNGIITCTRRATYLVQHLDQPQFCPIPRSTGARRPRGQGPDHHTRDKQRAHWSASQAHLLLGGYHAYDARDTAQSLAAEAQAVTV